MKFYNNCVIILLLCLTITKASFDFESLKSNLIKDVEKYKIKTNLVKNSLKKRKVHRKFQFLESTDISFINALRKYSIHFSKDDPETFRAKIIALKYIKNNELLKEFMPYGANQEEVKNKHWQGYIVLLKNIEDESTKVIKVCMPLENTVNIALVTKTIIDNCDKSVEILTEPLKISKTNTSFLEQENKNKLYAIKSLADKFSMDELSKIKALIKFAKMNKVLDKIYEFHGEIKLEDLARNSTALIDEVKQIIKSNTEILSKSINQVYQLANLTYNKLQNIEKEKGISPNSEENNENKIESDQQQNTDQVQVTQTESRNVENKNKNKNLKNIKKNNNPKVEIQDKINKNKRNSQYQNKQIKKNVESKKPNPLLELDQSDDDDDAFVDKI